MPSTSGKHVPNENEFDPRPSFKQGFVEGRGDEGSPWPSANDDDDELYDDVIDVEVVEEVTVPTERELLSDLTTAVGKYIDADERPRPKELWTAMCEAWAKARVYLNTGETGD